MARYLGHKEASAVTLLADAGVRILNAADSASPQFVEVFESVLPEDLRIDRVRMTAKPPALSDRDQGMGAWHVNNASEFHTIEGGEGIVEFWTAEGAVPVLLGAGDVMVVVQGAEHRYLPLTDQHWVIRYSIPGDLVGTETGRPSGPWPQI